MIFGINTTRDISKLSQITYNNFEISLVVFMPNITTNHAIPCTNSKFPIQLHQQDEIRRLLNGNVDFRKRKFNFPLREIRVYVTFPLLRLRGNASF